MPIPPAVVATATLEAMKLLKDIARDRNVPVSQEFLDAQEQLVIAAADEANELDRELPHDREP